MIVVEAYVNEGLVVISVGDIGVYVNGGVGEVVAAGVFVSNVDEGLIVFSAGDMRVYVSGGIGDTIAAGVYVSD